MSRPRRALRAGLPRGEGAVRDAIGAASSGAMVSGSARVVDGDSLEVRGTRVRLHGVDAPESGQRWRYGRSAPLRRWSSVSLGGPSSTLSETATATGVSWRCAGSAGRRQRVDGLASQRHSACLQGVHQGAIVDGGECAVAGLGSGRYAYTGRFGLNRSGP